MRKEYGRYERRKEYGRYERRKAYGRYERKKEFGRYSMKGERSYRKYERRGGMKGMRIWEVQ
jgi:hypothetical protein